MGERVSILIVDDEPGMTETLSDIMDNMGYDVATAEDGHRAIEIIRKKAYDIALMDIKMPGINGVETFKQFKQISPVTKVIMMTAYELDDLVEEAKAEGACGIFYKPLVIREVLALVKELSELKAGSTFETTR